MQLSVNVISESGLSPGQGVHTAFLEHLTILEQQGIPFEKNTFKQTTVAHAHTIGSLFWLLSNKADLKVMTAHVIPDSFKGSLIASELWLPAITWYLKRVYNHADLILAVAPEVKEKLELLGVKTPIVFLPNPINRAKFFKDAELRQSMRKDLGYLEDDVVIASSGQIQPRKGVASFIETARQLPDYKFLWIGGRPFGRLTSDYEKLTELLENAPPNVTVTGQVAYEKMNAYYNASDLFFFPSHQENLPFSLLEAASCALPILIRDNTNYQSLFESYVIKANEESFASTIKKHISSKDLYKHYEQKALELADSYSSQKIGEELIAIYQDWLAKKL